VILLKAIIQTTVCPMPHMLAELCPESPGDTRVAGRRDPVWRYASDNLGRSKEDLCRGEVEVFAEHHVD
jgi:hypothetical protein